MSKPPRIEAILDRQARAWDMREKLAREGGEQARKALAHLKQGPWLSVSRQLGAGGRALTDRLAQALGWQVYESGILSSIAEHTKTRESVLSRVDRREIGTFRDYVAHLVVPDDPGRLALVHEVTQVMWGLARQGQAILVGRGANWFLDARYGLRLRVIAPPEARAARIAEREEIGKAEAMRAIRVHDARRTAFIREYFDRDIDDPMGYDLVINTAELEPASAAAAVVAALHGKFET